MKQIARILVFLLFCFLAPKASAKACANWDLFADLLIWKASEAGADNWAEEITTVGVLLPTRTNHLKEVSFQWDVGFRLGAYCPISKHRWSMRVDYTRFNTLGKDRLRGAPGTIHSTFLGNFYVNNFNGAGISGPAYQFAAIQWGVDFNIFDLDVGRNFCLVDTILFRPFWGLKGGWINQSIHSIWENPDIQTKYYNVGKENVKNDFWGVGVQGGVNSCWQFFSTPCQRFSLFSDFSCAMMYGHWSFSDLFSNDIGEKIDVSLQDVNSGASVFQLFMGLQWGGSFRNEGCRISLKIGFEVQIWLDQLKYYSFTGGRLGNQLTLQGGNLEFNIGF